MCGDRIEDRLYDSFTYHIDKSDSSNDYQALANNKA